MSHQMDFHHVVSKSNSAMVRLARSDGVTPRDIVNSRITRS